MAFKTLDERFDPSLELPVKLKDGTVKTYKIKPVDIDTGIEVTAMMGIAARNHLQKSDPTPDEIAEIIRTNDGQNSLYQRVLGDVYDELKADGVDFEVIKLFGTVVTVWVTAGIDEAETLWNNGGQPPKARRQPADRKPRKPSVKRTKQV